MVAKNWQRVREVQAKQETHDKILYVPIDCQSRRLLRGFVDGAGESKEKGRKNERVGTETPKLASLPKTKLVCLVMFITKQTHQDPYSISWPIRVAGGVDWPALEDPFRSRPAVLVLVLQSARVIITGVLSINWNYCSLSIFDSSSFNSLEDIFKLFLPVPPLNPKEHPYKVMRVSRITSSPLYVKDFPSKLSSVCLAFALPHSIVPVMFSFSPLLPPVLTS